MSNFTKLMQQAAAGSGGADLDHYWLGYFGTSSKDEAVSVAVDSEGNIVTLTKTESIGSASFLVTKHDPSGDLVWTNTLYGSAYTFPHGVAIDSNDNIILGGRSRNWNTTGNYGFVAMKLNSDGEEQWSRSYDGSGNDMAYGGVAVDTNDNVIVAGNTVSAGAGAEDFLVVKWNSSGTYQWARTIGSTGYEVCFGVATDSSDRIILSGYTSSVGYGSYDMYILKLNSDGTHFSNIALGGTSSEFSRGVAVDSSDNVYVTGRTASDGAGNYDIVICKLSSNLGTYWKRTLGGSAADEGYGIAIDSEDNVIVSGYTSNNTEGLTDLVVAKYNSSGTIQWQRMVGGTDEEAIDTNNNVAVDQNDNIIIVGYTGEGGGSNNTFIMKIPADGGGTGTYGNFVYKTASLTDDAASLSPTYPSFTNSTVSFNEAAATPSETTSTFATDTFYDITT